MIASDVAAMLGDVRREGRSADVIDRPTDEDLALQDCAERVRALKKTTTENIIKIGKELIFAKDRLGHGRFGNWLNANALGISDRTARRYMQLAQWADSNSDTVSVLEPAAAYLLSAPSTPACVTSEVTARITGGDAMPVESVRLLIKVARSEQREAELNERPARARRVGARGKAERGQMEQRQEAEKTAATQFANLLRGRVDEIRGTLAELLAVTNGADLLEALKTELGPSSATPSVPDEVVPPACASTVSEMPEIPDFLWRAPQSPADQPA
jgi:hypothetical protein